MPTVNGKPWQTTVPKLGSEVDGVEGDDGNFCCHQYLL